MIIKNVYPLPDFVNKQRVAFDINFAQDADLPGVFHSGFGFYLLRSDVHRFVVRKFSFDLALVGTPIEGECGQEQEKNEGGLRAEGGFRFHDQVGLDARV